MFTQDSRPAPGTTPSFPTSSSLRWQELHCGIMGCYREKTSSLFARFAPQTSLRRALTSVLCARPFNLTFTVFKFPDELILSVASHISPELIGHYARFRIQDELGVYDYHRQRMRVLRQLSMTCRTMRSRLLPWILERLEVEMPTQCNWSSGETVGGRLNTVVNALHANTFMADSVRYFCALLYSWIGANRLFVSSEGS